MINFDQAVVLFLAVFGVVFIGGLLLVEWIGSRYGDRAESIAVAVISAIILGGAVIHFSP